MDNFESLESISCVCLFVFFFWRKISMNDELCFFFFWRSISMNDELKSWNLLSFVSEMGIARLFVNIYLFVTVSALPFLSIG